MLTHQRRSRACPRSTRPLTHLAFSTPGQRLGENSRTEPKAVFNDHWYELLRVPRGGARSASRRNGGRETAPPRPHEAGSASRPAGKVWALPLGRFVIFGARLHRRTSRSRRLHRIRKPDTYFSSRPLRQLGLH
ncbi:hypothetical protein DK412_03310 [Methylobacterium sp. 17Sr1-1]|nr:hypothetical protein DK412_03310 [Methylobacterium sp. 17Sr1-1]